MKCLGGENFIGTFVWQSKKGGGSDNSGFVNDQEYIFCFSKRSIDNSISKITIESEPLDREDEKGMYRRGRELNKWGANSRREDRPTMFFPIIGPNGEDVYPIRNDGKEGCWRWGKKKMFEAVESKNLEFSKRQDGTYIVYEKIRSNNPRTKPFRTWLVDVGTTADGSKIVKDNGNLYNYRFSSTDPDGSDVYLYFEMYTMPGIWWSELLPNNSVLENGAFWPEVGNFTVRAKAKDPYGAESDWATLEVNIAKSKSIIFISPLITWIFERFPFYEKILNQILL